MKKLFFLLTALVIISTHSKAQLQPSDPFTETVVDYTTNTSPYANYYMSRVDYGKYQYSQGPDAGKYFFGIGFDIYLQDDENPSNNIKSYAVAVTINYKDGSYSQDYVTDSVPTPAYWTSSLPIIIHPNVGIDTSKEIENVNFFYELLYWDDTWVSKDITWTPIP